MSKTRYATAGPGSPRSLARRAAGFARPAGSTTTSSPSMTAERARIRAGRSSSSGRSPARSRPVASRSRSGPRSADSMNARARSPSQDGSKRWSDESNGSGAGRGSIGRSCSGRRGSPGSNRSDSWSLIVARWYRLHCGPSPETVLVPVLLESPDACARRLDASRRASSDPPLVRDRTPLHPSRVRIPMPRPARPEDMYGFRIATDPR